VNGASTALTYLVFLSLFVGLCVACIRPFEDKLRGIWHTPGEPGWKEDLTEDEDIAALRRELGR